MDSKVGLIIQLCGIALIAALTIFLTKSLKSVALKYWKYAWLALSFALFGLYVAFNFESAGGIFFACYYLCEYVFAYFLIAGCRNYTSGERIARRDWLLLIPAASLAILLAFPFGDFNEVFNLHSLVMSALFAAAFFVLKPPDKLPYNPGWLVMKFALALLAFNFLHYAVIFSLRHTAYPQLLGKYLAFNSVIDLVIETLLGFGMVIMLLERVQQEVEDSNQRIRAAHDKLEQLAHVDPLTAAYTRHAFYNFLQKHRRPEEGAGISGCVGVFDVDNLKPINDRYGHAAGDAAITVVAQNLRSLVRADDLVFRWGGDEFFVVMLGIGSRQAIERMCELNERLERTNLFGADREDLPIRVSFGFADFGGINHLEKSVREADAEMYRAKQQNKCADQKLLSLSVRAIPSSETSATVH